MRNKTDFLIWAGVVAVFVIIVIILFGFVLKKADPRTFCETKDDCVCGGFDDKTGACFIGNTDYYNKYVNKTRQCPDFCGGIASNLEIRCENNTCMQRNKNIA